MVAFLDANVLYPATMRSVFMSLAEADVFKALWSDKVHEEWMAALQRERPDLDPQRIARTRALMEAYIDDATVTGYEPLIATLTLPDPDDRHVLAAAIHGGANVIVTSNLRDFPAAALAPFRITAIDPDSFVLQLIAADVDGVVGALASDRVDLIKPPLDADAYLKALDHGGLATTAAALRSMAGRL